jgi:Holliday junction DNA helicase RuvB
MEPNNLMREPYDDAEDAKEAGLRPKLLKDFQGQDEIKANLSVFIAAARERGEPIDHLFLSGPPGLGKTTLAGIVSSEMGRISR